MTIREKLEHAMEYGYPVRVLYGHNGEERTGKILSIGEFYFTIDFRSGHTLSLTDVFKVEPVSEITEEATAQISPGMKILIKSFADTKEKMEKAIIAWGKEMSRLLLERNEASEDCDDIPDVEIAEIDADEKWECVLQGGTDPLATVKVWKENGGGVFLRVVAENVWAKDAKATATLPCLVKQRDKLLEAGKDLVERLSGLKYVSPGGMKDVDIHCRTLSEWIACIEKNPLIRLTDS